MDNKRHGKGKVYYKGVMLLFEGEFYNDYLFKGKEYKNGKVEFEGEYLFDNKWDGIGYDKNGNIAYKLINGKGKITEYDLNGNVIFEGEFLNGSENRKGKEYFNGELVFSGEFVNGKRWNGNGKEYDRKKNLIFEGKYVNGKKISES